MSRYACYVPFLSLRRCSWNSRRLRSTALSKCGRRQWSSAASFTLHRTYGARCRQLVCKQTTARTRSSLYAFDSYQLPHLLTFMMYISCLAGHTKLPCSLSTSGTTTMRRRSDWLPQPTPWKLGTVALTLLWAATTPAYGSSSVPSIGSRAL